MTNAVRAWLKAQKGVSKSKLTLDERIANFRADLYAWRAKNPGKYSDAMYKEFFDHWTEHSPGATRMARDRVNDFDIGKRLATCYRLIWEPRQYQQQQRQSRENNNRTDNTKRPVDFDINRAMQNAADAGRTLPGWATGESID